MLELKEEYLYYSEEVDNVFIVCREFRDLYCIHYSSCIGFYDDTLESNVKKWECLGKL